MTFQLRTGRPGLALLVLLLVAGLLASCSRSGDAGTTFDEGRWDSARWQ